MKSLVEVFETMFFNFLWCIFGLLLLMTSQFSCCYLRGVCARAPVCGKANKLVVWTMVARDVDISPFSRWLCAKCICFNSSFFLFSFFNFFFYNRFEQFIWLPCSFLCVQLLIFTNLHHIYLHNSWGGK